MRPCVIVGNWKMNLLTAEAVDFVEALEKNLAKNKTPAHIAVCPSFTLLAAVRAARKNTDLIALGAQDCSAHQSGAFTGEVSARMLKDAGCRYVILGHSERRAYHDESSMRVQAKAAAAHQEGIVTILCVGETESEKDNGNTNQVTEKQLIGSLPKTAGPKNTIIAYEPVWAIGTGRTPFAKEVQDVHKHLRTVLGALMGKEAADLVPLLYGGSVKAENAKELMSLEDVDGALVGGAALKADSFLGIIHAL